MMYRVIKAFRDARDEGHLYEIGDVYPREGYTSSARRTSALAGEKNKLGTPVIEKIAVEEE